MNDQRIDGRALLAAARVAMTHAHAPYSRYRVGAAVQTDGGRVFAGCNVENASYGLTNCAERTAVFKAVSEGARRVTAVAIVADGAAEPVPCGACRQVLAEFADAATPVWIAPARPGARARRVTLGRLLPLAFKLEEARPVRRGRGA